MAYSPIVTIDLYLQNSPQTLASYLVRHNDGAVLIESGPSSTLPALKAALAEGGLAPADITHVLLTHVHLDHSGAAGWLARQGSEICVHPRGAPHLVNPAKLLASAARLYGKRMDRLWGDILPVEESRVRMAQDGEAIVIGSLRFLVIHTPGHAEHHCAYLLEDACFCGDVGGVRLPGYGCLRAPMPPPELHLERWHESIRRLRSSKVSRLALTHFGIYDDAEGHLAWLERILTDTEKWLESVMAASPSVEDLRKRLSVWLEEQGSLKHLSKEGAGKYSLASPVSADADGLMRYWKSQRSRR